MIVLLFIFILLPVYQIGLTTTISQQRFISGISTKIPNSMFSFSASTNDNSNTVHKMLSQLGSIEFPGGNPRDLFPLRSSIAIDLWPGIYYPEDVDIYKPLIEDLHARGIKYMIYRNLFQITDVNYTKLYEYYPDFTPENASFIDLDGNPKIIGYDSYGSPIFYLSTNRPYWRSFLINSTKLAIDAGSDMVVFDVGFGHYPPNEQNFDPDSIAGFRDFLANKYNSTQLKDKFNISDITTFDFGQYLRDLGYDANSLKAKLENGQPLGGYADALWEEWDEFHLSVLVDFYKTMYTELKAYAQSKGREFYIFANIYASLYPTRNILYLINYVDGIFAEIFYEDMQYPRYTAATAYRTVYSLGKHYIPMTSPNSSTELYPLYVGELFSSGGWIVSDNVPNYFMFISEHPELFGKELDGELGLVYSLASCDNYTSFEGAYHLLSNIQRSFEIITFGDNKWFNESLTLDDLSKYKAIILPSTSYLTEAQISLLLNYTKQGGTLIGIGSGIGKYNENGEIPTSAERQTFVELFNGSINSYGNGTVFSWTDNIAITYYTDRNTSLLADFENELENIVPSGITTDFGNNITVFQFWDEASKSMIFHFVNFDYNSSSELINPQSNKFFTFGLRQELSGKELEITYYSPDTYYNGTELVYTVVENGRINVTVPYLHIWGFLRIRPKPAAQQDLIISTPTVFRDQTIILNGNLIVNSKLTLENVILKINSSIERTYHIEINDGGELIVDNSKITALNSDYHYYIQAKQGSKLFVLSSKIEYAGIWGPMEMGGIWINTEDIVFANTTITDSYDYGIFLYNVSHVIISNCSIYNNNIGIYIVNTSYVLISDCKLYNNSVGIYEYETYHTKVQDSQMYENTYWGIIIWDSLFPLVNNSVVYSNGLDGIIVWRSLFTKIYESEFYENENGINIRNTPIVTVSTSSAHNNAKAGLLLYHVELLYDNIYGILKALGTVVASEFYNNTYGIYMEDSEHTKIAESALYNNTYGLYVDGPTILTFVYRNNFIDNDNQTHLSDQAKGRIQFDNMTHGNYWSDFSGPDTNVMEL